jgi:ABC-type amino acid transport substrate-binding protein
MVVGTKEVPPFGIKDPDGTLTGLSIAVRKTSGSDWSATLDTFTSWAFARLIGVLVVVLLGAAFGVWLFERRANPEQYLRARHLGTNSVATSDEALKAVESGDAAASVYDTPILKYAVQAHPALTLLPVTFEPMNYAIVLPQHSPLREPLDIALLQHVQSDAWRLKVERYLGE